MLNPLGALEPVPAFGARAASTDLAKHHRPALPASYVSFHQGGLDDQISAPAVMKPGQRVRGPWK